MKHRGMGGNPKGDRTKLPLLVTLCREHHRRFDSGKLKITPLTDCGADGLLMFQEA